MRILHIITSLLTGGAEKLMVDLLPRLRERGHDVELLLMYGADTPFRQQLEKEGIKVMDLGQTPSFYSPLKFLKMLPHLKRYDVIHTHNTSPQIFAAVGNLLFGRRLVTTEHSTSNRRRGWRGFRAIDRWMYRRYDRIICISAKAQENLQEYLGEISTPILTVNNGVDVPRYAEAEPSPELESIAPGSRKIIMVAAFRWEKDQDTLIKAMQLLPEQFHLFLVGYGQRQELCTALANELGVSQRVHFMGMRTDVPQLLHAADYVVMSSHFEGLSLSSVEGMSSGRPFLASDVDGLREVVTGAGVLFPHQDSRALANEIMKLENDSKLYHRVADRCVREAKRYDISTMADAYSNLYNQL